jgi:hypothetical protein
MKRRLISLDRIAGQMNGWLLAIAIGLGMLDLTVLVAKSLPTVSIPAAAGSPDAGSSATRDPASRS